MHNCDQTHTKDLNYYKSSIPEERLKCRQRSMQQNKKLTKFAKSLQNQPKEVPLNPTRQRYYKKTRLSLQHCAIQKQRTQREMLTNYRSLTLVQKPDSAVQQNEVNVAVRAQSKGRDQLHTSQLLAYAKFNHKLTKFPSKHFPATMPSTMNENLVDVSSVYYWFCNRTPANKICTSAQQQTLKHIRKRIPAAARFHNQATVQANKHTKLQHKSFTAIPIKALPRNWRDWLFRCAATTHRVSARPQKPVRQHIVSTATSCVNTSNNSAYQQQHTKYLYTHLPALLFITTLLLFLLSALPSVRAACRKEPARTCESICTPDNLNCTLRALLLLPDDNAYTASMCRTMPVLDLADQYIRENSLLPPHVNLEWMTGDVKCDAAYASIKAMDGIVKNCAHVVFGPVCDYALAAVSRIAKYFNSNGTPVISIGGATDSFEDKKTTCADEFYMLVRAGVLSFKSLSLMIIELMKRYNWSNSIAFYERDGQSNVVGEHSCYLMMKSFGDEMRNLNLTFAQYSIVPELRNRTEELVREIGNKHTSKAFCTTLMGVLFNEQCQIMKNV